ncbi:hypothetical protein HH682_07540 [Rosenbergiella sp. S61]|uniref:Uncharacterized protein n=1 Tax=Rosenbergiella gaditana TaxID=2726987 RepID=A0ABS5SYH5_9GAMM|nr:hypothetical protein [Rosenbergiella gaditana]MBT0724292.1 hypothetical protein [Rosenbergiella gaditana]
MAADDENPLIDGFLSGNKELFAIISDKILPSIQIQTINNFYDYNAKYLSDEKRYFCSSGRIVREDHH